MFFLKEDLSFNKKARQSVTLPGEYYASYAVDRILSTCTRANEIGTSSLKTVWWRVDLGGVYNIHNINIQFKTYAGEGIVFIYIPIYMYVYSFQPIIACIHQ